MKIRKAALGLLIILAPLVSHGTLIGDTINVSFTSPEGSGDMDIMVTEFEELVGPGFGLVAGEFIDITGDSIIAGIVEAFDPGEAFYLFSGLDWVGEAGRIIGFELSFEDIIGLSIDDITFGDDFIRIDVAGVDLDPASEASVGIMTLRLLVAHEEPPPVTVPEPGTLALLGIGLAGMGLARRRKKV